MSAEFDDLNAGTARAGFAWLREAAQDEFVAPITPRRISIFGLGYVGAVSLACLARDGHEITGVDVDPGKLELLRAGRAPIVETGIQELMRAVVRGGAVNITSSVREAILATDLSFVCVGTPAGPNGNQDLTAITRIGEQIGAVLPEKDSHHLVVIRSTVRPGTVEDVLQPVIELYGDRKSVV